MRSGDGGSYGALRCWPCLLHVNRLTRLLWRPKASSAPPFQRARNVPLCASCVQVRVSGRINVSFYDQQAGFTILEPVDIPARSQVPRGGCWRVGRQQGSLQPGSMHDEVRDHGLETCSSCGFQEDRFKILWQRCTG